MWSISLTLATRPIHFATDKPSNLLNVDSIDISLFVQYSCHDVVPNLFVLAVCQNPSASPALKLFHCNLNVWLGVKNCLCGDRKYTWTVDKLHISLHRIQERVDLHQLGWHVKTEKPLSPQFWHHVMSGRRPGSFDLLMIVAGVFQPWPCQASPWFVDLGLAQEEDELNACGSRRTCKLP